jgi:ubiquitin carboxyl-terminal hydrolase 7
MIEPLKGKQTLKAAELQDGDIVCFQRVSDKKTEGARASDKAPQETYAFIPTESAHLFSF